jgi:drug/metabolite transporter (DMT)-like permease
MIFLPLTIILTSFLTIAFKVLANLKIPALQAIVFNYITCVVVGSIVNGAYPLQALTNPEPWLYWCLFMGLIFITLFNIIAFTTRHLGVAVASVANKLSLVIPFLFSIFFYGETATVLKIFGVVLALIAVAFTCWPHSEIKGSSLKPEHGWVLFVPVVLFLGSGSLDTMITYVEKTFLNTANKDSYFILAFNTAGILGAIYLVIQLLRGKEKFDPRSIIAGICIGLPNYFSLWTLVKVLSQYPGNSSAIFPIINIGIVLFSTLVAYFIFSEKLSRLNWTGIVLSVIAITLMAWG